jgi:predicted nucleotidyltransferase
MKPSLSISQHHDQAREILERAGMRNPRVSGPVSRGEDTEESNLDIFVEVPPGTTLYDLARVELEMEGVLGCKVEIVTEGSFAPNGADRVKAEFTPL